MTKFWGVGRSSFAVIWITPTVTDLHWRNWVIALFDSTKLWNLDSCTTCFLLKKGWRGMWATRWWHGFWPLLWVCWQLFQFPGHLCYYCLTFWVGLANVDKKTPCSSHSAVKGSFFSVQAFLPPPLFLSIYLCLLYFLSGFKVDF